jgi:hypothetical protein
MGSGLTSTIRYSAHHPPVLSKKSCPPILSLNAMQLKDGTQSSWRPNQSRESILAHIIKTRSLRCALKPLTVELHVHAGAWVCCPTALQGLAQAALLANSWRDTLVL